MKKSLVAFALVAAAQLVASPAFAQLGGLGGALKKAQQAQDTKKKIDDINVDEQEERKIGEDVSAKIRARFGVVQDEAVHKYVTLVGTALAQQSERPKLNWTFIVLDTDGVNAFASPGGIVHITRGALGLIRTEAELAGVLGHEITHVSHKHAVNAIMKGNAVKAGSDVAGSRVAFLDTVSNKVYEMVLENKFDRNDEMDSDKTGVALVQKVGYSPNGLAEFLTRLDERNKDTPTQNGLFASHPDTKARIEKVTSNAKGATVEARYKDNIKYEPTAITSIATVVEGASGLTGSSKEEPKKEEPKKKGFGLSALTKTASSEKQTAQVSASGGARGVGPDRDAKGGSNPNPVKVTVSTADVDAFKKGIA
jgi:beta-barrel assembly-enhancing protease